MVGGNAPLSPAEDRPTDAQTRGVGGGAACASTSATPASSNLGSTSAAILCLLNAERLAAGLGSHPVSLTPLGRRSTKRRENMQLTHASL